jgi:type VI protein secretion system component VasF
MSANLIIALQQVTDHRSRQGQRYPLWFVLLLIVMATLTGTHSYKSLEDFGKRHYCALKELLRLDISGFPSDTTIRLCLVFAVAGGKS